MTSLPRESRCSDRESGDRPFGWEWVPLSCGRGIGERGLSRAESCGGFRLVWAPNPAAGRLASEAAAFPQLCCCSSRGVVQVQLVSLETKSRRERSEIDNKNPRRNESRRAVVSPPRRGKVVDADTGFAVCPWECTRQWSTYVCTACWMGNFPVESGVKSRASR